MFNTRAGYRTQAKRAFLLGRSYRGLLRGWGLLEEAVDFGTLVGLENAAAGIHEERLLEIVPDGIPIVEGGTHLGEMKKCPGADRGPGGGQIDAAAELRLGGLEPPQRVQGESQRVVHVWIVREGGSGTAGKVKGLGGGCGALSQKPGEIVHHGGVGWRERVGGAERLFRERLVTELHEQRPENGVSGRLARRVADDTLQETTGVRQDRRIGAGQKRLGRGAQHSGVVSELFRSSGELDELGKLRAARQPGQAGAADGTAGRIGLLGGVDPTLSRFRIAGSGAGIGQEERALHIRGLRELSFQALNGGLMLAKTNQENVEDGLKRVIRRKLRQTCIELAAKVAEGGRISGCICDVDEERVRLRVVGRETKDSAGEESHAG
jgi:hypothetical protein